MPKKSRRRPASSSSLLSLAAVLALAALAGWWLLTPRPHAPPKPVAALTPTPAQSESAQPIETESPTPQPAATASPLESATPLPTIAPRATGSGGAAKLALIVDDCGQWLDTERGFIALGIPLTLSVLPDVRYTGSIAREASDAGKGVMLHLPMETISGMNPGPGKVTTEMTDAQIVAQVNADLAQVPLARGVNNHEGSKGSSDMRVMDDAEGFSTYETTRRA